MVVEVVEALSDSFLDDVTVEHLTSPRFVIAIAIAGCPQRTSVHRLNTTLAFTPPKPNPFHSNKLARTSTPTVTMAEH
jgi:hypothetical protein